MAILNQKTLQIDITVRKYEVEHKGDPLDEGAIDVKLKETNAKNSLSLSEAIRYLIDLLPNN